VPLYVPGATDHPPVRHAFCIRWFGTGELTVASVCRAARVSTSFLDRHLDVRAEVAGILAAAVTEPAGSGSSRVTLRSMQADLENQKAQNHRLRTKVQVLERRLSELLGIAVVCEEQPTTVEGSDARAERLEQEVLELRDKAACAETELAAVRQINRELTEALNSPRGKR
jgi:hypothetical protein